MDKQGLAGQLVGQLQEFEEALHGAAASQAPGAKLFTHEQSNAARDALWVWFNDHGVGRLNEASNETSDVRMAVYHLLDVIEANSEVPDDWPEYPEARQVLVDRPAERKWHGMT